MARAVSSGRKTAFTVLGWTVGLLIFFPILWIAILAFKPEPYAVAPNWGGLFSLWTTDNFAEVQSRSDYFRYFWNSVIISIGSTLLGLLIAVPAAWAMAFSPTRQTKNILMWMLSTKMLPAVGVLVPITFLSRGFNLFETERGLFGTGVLEFLFGWFWSGSVPQLLDTHVLMIIVLMLINLPIIVWMLFTYFKEIPNDILEAARMDGASLRNEIMQVLVPMAVPGIASTLLLNVILAWNEAFWTLMLTTTQAAPLTQFIASYSSPEGLFYAKLSAASTLAIAPILVLGWFSQKQLVRGLTFGAVK